MPKKNNTVPRLAEVFMKNSQGLFLSFLLLLLALAQLACGSSGGGNNDPTAPSAVSYSANPAVYLRDVAIAANTPTVSGGAATSFTVNPALPAGLALDATSGVITGTPTVASAAASYFVTAANAAGSAQVALSIAVTEGPVAPSITTQPQASQTVTAGASASFTVVATGTAPLSYQWRKGGTAIGGATSATYTIASAVVGDSGTYTVTVSNGTAPDAVSDNAVLTVNAGSAAPVISYPSSPFTFFVGTAIPTITPTNTGGVAIAWGISPGLPAGLAFNAGTGQITGTPTATSAASTYTVTATNAAGSGTASLSITVRTPDNSYGAVSASRTSGVAPLMVHFSTDYAGTPQGSMGFHNYDYAWDFGDPSSGVWGTNGKSKNAAKGAVAAHVYETPGTHTATLTVRDQNGVIGAESFTITVQDPEVVYAGNKTTCVNPAGDTNFTGAPGGSRQIATDDLSSITQYATAGSRILFKRGASWSTPDITNWPENAGPVTIGAYGTGVKPQIVVVGGTFFDFSFKQDWRIMDLSFFDNTKKCTAIGGSSACQRITILRISTDGFGYPVACGNWNHSYVLPIDATAVVDSTIANAGEMGLYIGAERLVILGTVVSGADDSHVVRVWQGYKSVISNNRISGSSLTTNTGRHALKFHCSPISEININPRPNSSDLRYGSEFTIISDNIFGSSGPWPIAIQPTDKWTDQRISNIIFEKNVYSGDYGQKSLASNSLMISLRIHARQVSVRNNIFDASNFGTEITGIDIVGSEDTAPTSKDIWVYNNTIYKTSNPNGVSWVGINIKIGAEDVIVRNNLVSFPYTSNGHTAVRNQGTRTEVSNNILNGTFGFVDPNNSNPLARSFALTGESTDAIDKGFLLPSVFEDFTGNPRPVGAAWDIGAYEFR